MNDLEALAYGTLFPVTTELDLSNDILRFLDRGGKAVLFGEHADEYTSGRMRPARVAAESAERWQNASAAIRRRAETAVIALDADISAVHRLHRLTPELPSLSAATTMAAGDFEADIAAMAAAAKNLGINLLLSPTADVVIGENSWLAGRTLGHDVETVSRLVAGYVRCAKRAGIHCSLKHFPGHPRLSGHPAIDEHAVVPGSLEELRPFLRPFAAGIAAGVDAVMMSPATYEAVDPLVAGSISPQLIRLLREDLRFRGVVMTCDLDHRATARGRDISEVAVDAIIAGADLPPVSPAAVPDLEKIAKAIAVAASRDEVAVARLRAAVMAINVLAR